MGKLNKGVFIGLLLGAGMMWLNTTKKGKEIREQIINYSSDVFEKLKKEVKASGTYGKLTKNEYLKMAKKYVEKYAVEKGLAGNVKKMVMRIVTAQWNNLKNELDQVK